MKVQASVKKRCKFWRSDKTGAEQNLPGKIKNNI